MVPIMAQNLETQAGVAHLPKQEDKPIFLQPQAQGRVETGTRQMDIGPGQGGQCHKTIQRGVGAEETS